MSLPFIRHIAETGAKIGENVRQGHIATLTLARAPHKASHISEQGSAGSTDFRGISRINDLAGRLAETEAASA